ncbi:MAG: hypothetical protein WC705_02745 [Candidatus Paceibacterota bacterium]|jgi:hypothetical protein
MAYQDWSSFFLNPLQDAWATVIRFLPSLIGALIVLFVGLLVAALLRAVFEKIVGALRIDSLLRKLGVEPFIERSGYHLSSGKFVGGLVYWFFVVVVVLAVSDILNLWGLSSFLNSVLIYFPNIIVAVLVMIVALIVANFLRNLVRGSIMGAKLHASKFLGTLAWWSVAIFGFLAALLQLGVAAQLIEMIITGVVAMLALAGGIAFGLGGKEYASHLIGKFRDHTEM